MQLQHVVKGKLNKRKLKVCGHKILLDTEGDWVMVFNATFNNVSYSVEHVDHF